MNLKSIAASALFTTTLVFAAAAPVQATEDVKSFHASGGCKVYGATPWTSLGFGWQGIANTTTSPVQIVCPLVTDAESNWSDSVAAQNAWVHLHARSGSVANNVSCTIFSMYATTVYDTDTVTISLAANDWSNGDSPLLINAGPDGGSLMMCQLGPKMTLSHYTLHEVGATHTP